MSLDPLNLIASHGRGELYQLGEREVFDVEVGDDVDFLVLAAWEVQPDEGRLYAFKKHLRAGYDDMILTTPDEFRVVTAHACAAANKLVSYLQRGKRCVSNCRGGYNRSSLISGLAMLTLGWTSDSIIEAVRRSRGPIAFSNPSFVKILRKVEASRKAIDEASRRMNG